MSIQRRVALIGSGMGPWISTKGLSEPRAKVTGMRPGGRLQILMSHAEDPQTDTSLRQSIEENGIVVLQEAQWMRVICDQGGRNVICDILSKKAVA